MTLLIDVIKGYTYFRDDDVLLAKITPCFENGKAGIAKCLVNGIGFGSTEFIILRPNGKVLAEWIYYFISADKFVNVGRNRMTGSAGQQRLSMDFVKGFRIPLPPLSVQKEIVAEIEGYQKKIEEAKQFIAAQECRIRERIDKVWGV